MRKVLFLLVAGCAAAGCLTQPCTEVFDTQQACEELAADAHLRSCLSEPNEALGSHFEPRCPFMDRRCGLLSNMCVARWESCRKRLVAAPDCAEAKRIFNADPNCVLMCTLP